MARTIQPELLDTLTPQHPDAQHSRRDLRLINKIMGNHRWLARALRNRGDTAGRILEIGAGLGEFSRAMRREGREVDALDLWPRPPAWPADLRWHSADLRTFTGYPEYPVLVGNLIFHQFTDAELTALGPVLRAESRVIIACEPCRSGCHRALFGFFAPLFGANRVTLHDGRVSIAAGFLGHELPHLLGLAAPEWTIECRTTLLGAYHMIATRRS